MTALAALTTGADATGVNVTVVPWCNNSMRVMVNPLGAAHAALGLGDNPPGGDPGEPFAALDGAVCTPGAPVSFFQQDGKAVSGNLQLSLAKGILSFSRLDTGGLYFSAAPAAFGTSATPGFATAGLSLAAGDDKDERIFGLGQGNWSYNATLGRSPIDWCASKAERVVPLERNGQTVGLQQQKLHITIPFAYSTAGYGFLWNMPGQGRVSVGAAGVGGMEWTAEATTGLDFWVTGAPKGNTDKAAVARAAVYEQYADATGHAPPLREDAMIFWQSRNRYKSSDIVLAVCDRYKALDLPVGVVVVDYKNQDFDGDFAPNPLCYPSVANLSAGVRARLNATTMFSFWPEAFKQSAEYSLLKSKGCLINPDLGGNAIDPTTKACRDLIWNEFLKPRYYDQGVSTVWLDETDGEGTIPTPAPTPPTPPPTPSNWVAHPNENYHCGGDEFKGDLGTQASADACLAAVKAKGGVDFAIWNKNSPTCYICQVAKPQGIKFAAADGAFSFVNTAGGERRFGDGDGDGEGEGTGEFVYGHGYDTSYGPAAAYSNLWVNDWIKTFTDPVAALAVPGEPPMALTRAVWAGGQKHGVVLWSSDIESTFEELTAQINLGVHASLSGIPWWTSDVGGYGCGRAFPNGSPYMQELIVRWYQFGLFCPVFRTHGARPGGDPDPHVGKCALSTQQSAGPNEIWSYNSSKTQDMLASYITMRAEKIKPYIVELDAEVTATGVPTMRPLWFEFPEDASSYGVEDQYFLGSKLLVAPVTAQGATSRSVYFPPGAWKHFWTGAIEIGPATKTIDAPLAHFPAYERIPIPPPRLD